MRESVFLTTLRARFWTMNYYFTTLAGEKLLIGRSYAGWKFLLNVVPKKRLFVWEDWERFLLTPGDISVEDGINLSRASLSNIVLNRECFEPWETRGWEPYEGFEDEFHKGFRSERGEHGLLRLNEKTFSFLLARGEGATWDSVLKLENYTLGRYGWDYTPNSDKVKEE